MEGIERLQAEVLEMNNYNVSIIFDYLKTKNNLYEKFNNKEKSIKQMYKYIYEKARNLKQGNVAMVNDRVVFLWAITYFSKTNEELGIQEKKLVQATPAEIIEKKSKKMSKKEEKMPKETKSEDNQITLFQEVQ